MIDSLVEKLEKKVVLADGAMGTYFSQKYMTEMEAEEANIATPERIIAIHKEYIEAGAELIRTNTFAVNHGLFAEAERRKEVIEAAVANAREAVRQSRKEVVVAGSVGPIRQPKRKMEKFGKNIHRCWMCFILSGFVFSCLKHFRSFAGFRNWQNIVKIRKNRRWSLPNWH